MVMTLFYPHYIPIPYITQSIPIYHDISVEQYICEHDWVNWLVRYSLVQLMWQVSKIHNDKLYHTFSNTVAYRYSKWYIYIIAYKYQSIKTMYIYVHIYTHIYIHINIYTYIYIHINISYQHKMHTALGYFCLLHFPSFVEGASSSSSSITSSSSVTSSSSTHSSSSSTLDEENGAKPRDQLASCLKKSGWMRWWFMDVLMALVSSIHGV